MKILIHNIYIDNVTMIEAIEQLQKYLTSQNTNLVFTPNSEIIMESLSQPKLKNVLNSGSLVVPDGAGVVLASKILGTPLKERVAGFDLTTKFLALERSNKLKVYLLGAKEEVVKKAKYNMEIKFPYITIVGQTNGYFSLKDTPHIIENINSTEAHLLLVALGAPKQEQWLHNNKNQLKVPICIGVGGSFDVFAEVSTRAPKFFQENNLEWLYRLYKEPWRFFRMLALPKFILYSIFYRFFKSN